MKLLNWLLTFLFLLFAYFQYNDPDPWLWIGLYVFIALISGMASFGIYKKWLIGLGIGICLAGLLLLLPDFIEWIQGGAESIVESMKAEKPHIELTREFLGLGICLATLLFHWRQVNSG